MKTAISMLMVVGAVAAPMLVESYEAAAKNADALAKSHHEMAEAAARKVK